MPASIEIVEGQDQSGTVGEELSAPLRVLVRDESARAVPGQSVTFVVTSGGGSMFTGTSVTSGNGVAADRWMLGTATSDSQRVEARLVGGSGNALVVVFRAIPVPDAPTEMAKVAGDGQTGPAGAALEDSVEVMVSDQHGNPAAGSQITWTIAGGGHVSSPTTIADSSGHARTLWTLGTDASEPQRLTASAGIASVEFGASAVAPEPPSYAVTSSKSVAAVKTNVTITAQLIDTAGAPIAQAGRAVTWTKDKGAGSLSSATSTTNSDGVAMVTFTIGSAADVTTEITATDEDGFTGSVAVTSKAAGAAKLAFVTQPANTGFGIVFDPAIEVVVQDAYENTVEDSEARIFLDLTGGSGSATMSGSGSRIAEDGTVTWTNLRVNDAGADYKIVATSSGLTSATSNAFDVSAIGTVTEGHSDGIASLAVTDVYAHFLVCEPPTDDCDLYMVSNRGGDDTFIADFEVDSDGGRLVTDGTRVYLLYVHGGNAHNGVIWSQSKSGGDPTVRSMDLSDPFCEIPGPDLEVADSYTYVMWSTSSCSSSATGGIGRMPASGGAMKVLFARDGSGGGAAVSDPRFAIAGDHVFFQDSTDADGITISKIPVDSGTVEVVVTGLGGWVRGESPAMTVVDGTIYWLQWDDATSSYQIRSAPTTGGTSSIRATGLPSGSGRLMSDGTYLYVKNGGSIRRCRLSDFSCGNIVSNDNVTDFAISDDAIYWSTSDGAVKKIKR